MLSVFISLLIAPVARGADFSGSAIVNGCSGALFTLRGISATHPALVLTNGHCVRLKSLRGGGSDYPAPGETIIDLTGEAVSKNAYVILNSPSTSHQSPARALLFASMTGTDLAVYELRETFEDLEKLYGIRPFLLDNKAPEKGERLFIHSGYFSKTQSCLADGTTLLIEGSYSTHSALRLSSECEIYNGFSGSPMLRSDKRTFAALANTHNEADGAPCSMSNPCEYDKATGRKTTPAKGQSYGVPAHWLYQCLDLARGEFDFQSSSCIAIYRSFSLDG